MHKTLLIALFSLLCMTKVYCQNFEGRIVDSANNPVFGSTVLIEETKQGLACNDKGEFQVQLPVGEYHVEYRCLGYESRIEVITINARDKITRNIVLNDRPIQLAEVVVSNKEDPAYAIMRHAIAKAPYYQNIVKRYEAECYIKGNMELVKINSLVNKMSSSEGLKMSDYKDQLFVQESHSTIKYEAPDKYEQTVNAFASSIPDNLDSKDVMRLSSSSMYLPRFSGLVSPLNPQAFKFYKFRYEDYEIHGDKYINKIKVTPKMKDPELLEGYLYIADDTWDIRHTEFTSSQYGIQQTFSITYGKLSDNVYLPVSYSNSAEVNILGIEGYINYYSSVKYNSFEINDSIKNNIEKKKEKIDLEIKWDKTYSVKTDSLATKQDSLYWMQIRNIPLSVKEKDSFEKKDSIQQRIDSLRKQHNDAKFGPWDIVGGGRLGGDSTKFAFEYGGLVGALRDYNFVDGFGLGQKLKVSTKLGTNKSLAITPEVYYTTARKNIIWKTNVDFNYAPMRLGQLSVAVGDESTDFNRQGANRFDNAYSSLLWGKNVSMLYRNRYAKIGNKVDISNGLQLVTQLEYAKRSALANNTEYSVFGSERDVKTNIASPLHGDLLAYNIGVQYTPQHFYSVHDGKKQYRHSKYPTMGVHYSEGFSSWKSDNSRFRKLEGNINQMIKTDLFSQIIYEVNGGKFLGNRDKMNFADYEHVNTSGDLMLITKSPYSAFMLLNPYEASTNDYWFSTQFNYHSKYILLKRLPFLQGKMFDEGIHARYLYTPTKRNYTEVGYSIDLFNALSIGAHCSFDRFRYDSFGVSVSIDFQAINK